MATSMEFGGWRDQLNKHPVSKLLRENNAKESIFKHNIDTKSIFCTHGSNLFIWDASEGQILHCNLKTLSSQHLPSEECQQASQPRLDLGGSGSNANSSSPSISNIGNADSKDDTPQFQVPKLTA